MDGNRILFTVGAAFSLVGLMLAIHIENFGLIIANGALFIFTATCREICK